MPTTTQLPNSGYSKPWSSYSYPTALQLLESGSTPIVGLLSIFLCPEYPWLHTLVDVVEVPVVVFYIVGLCCEVAAGAVAGWETVQALRAG